MWGGDGSRAVARLFGVVVAMLVCVPAVEAGAQEAVDTRITSSPPNLHRSTDASFVFEGRIGDNEWGSCAYDPDLDRVVCATDFECSLDSAPWTPCRPAWTVRGLSDGYHEFAVRAVSLGVPDLTPATRAFRVKRTGDECFRAVEGVGRAESHLEDVLEVVASFVEKIRASKQAIRRLRGFQRRKARERLKEQRTRYREWRGNLRESRLALATAQAQQDAACSG
jgi:hypothetical protein